MEWMRLMCVSKRATARGREQASVCVQCNGVPYLFLEASGGVAVPAHPAEAAGGDEIGAEEGAVEMRRRRVHEGRGYLLLHGRPPGQARPLFR